MPSTPESRINGITTSVAVKAPCQIATTANITLSGLQTVNGLLVAATDRVLVKDQTDTTENGIYYPATGAWTRAPDFDGNLDAVNGTRILVGTSLVYSTVCADGAVVFDTSEITFLLTGVGAGTGVVSVTDFASIQTAISSFGPAGGALFFPPGTYSVTSTITLASDVKLWGQHGVELVWSGGSGSPMFTSATTTPLLRAGISGMTLNCGNASKCLELFSAWRFSLSDVEIESNSSTNFIIDLLCNSSGTTNDDGNYNNVFGYYANVLQTGTCGTFLRLRGNAVSPGQVVTLNSFVGINALSCKVRGIDFSRWCDSNTFAGMTRVSVTGTGGVGVEVNTDSPAAERGVYSMIFEHLAVDTFVIGGISGRTGLKLNLCKGIKVMYYYNDPIAEVSDFVFSSGTSSFEVKKVIVSKNFEQSLWLGQFLCIGATATEKYSIYTTSFTLRGTDEASIVLADTFSNEAAGTSAAGVTCAHHTQATVWTLATYYGFSATPMTLGAGSILTNYLGFYCADPTSGTNRFGFYHDVSASSTKYGFYGNGTAVNFLRGGVYVGAGSTSMTAGFIHIPGAAGLAVGVPTTYSGNYPFYYDATNNKIMVYNGAWRSTAALT